MTKTTVQILKSKWVNQKRISQVHEATENKRRATASRLGNSISTRMHRMKEYCIKLQAQHSECVDTISGKFSQQNLTCDLTKVKYSAQNRAFEPFILVCAANFFSQTLPNRFVQNHFELHYSWQSHRSIFLK